MTYIAYLTHKPASYSHIRQVVAEDNCVTAAGGGCVRVRGRHSGRPVREQRRRQGRRAAAASAPVHQRLHQLPRGLRHCPLHVQPSRPAALSAHRILGFAFRYCCFVTRIGYIIGRRLLKTSKGAQIRYPFSPFPSSLSSLFSLPSVSIKNITKRRQISMDA